MNGPPALQAAFRSTADRRLAPSGAPSGAAPHSLHQQHGHVDQMDDPLGYGT